MRFPQLVLALVFGSVAEGRQRQDSDLDIAVTAKLALTAVEKMDIIASLAEQTGRFYALSQPGISRKEGGMDREVVELKLESLRRCLQRIKTKCPEKADALLTDYDLQDIVSLNFSCAVQLFVDIGAHLISGMDVPPPDTMGQTFDRLEQTGMLTATLAINLKKAVGFRNIAVHNYDDINWHIVHSIVKNHL